MRKALGRGFEALFPEVPVSQGPTHQLIETSRIRPSAGQPRRSIDEKGLAELAESIREKGIIQPLVVRRAAEGGFELIAGERRLRAAQQAGLERVAAVIREATDAESFELALIENIQREDLSPLEEAGAYRRMIDEFRLTQEQVATRVGKSRATVTNMLRLLSLAPEVKAELAAGRLTMGHARALLAAPTAARQIALAREIIRRDLSVRQSERLAAAPSMNNRQRKLVAAKDVHLRSIEEDLCRLLATKVRVIPNGQGGCIQIEYHSADALQRLLEHLHRNDFQESNAL